MRAIPEPAGAVALLSSVILLDNICLAALSPLLAPLGEQYGLSAFALGLLVAAYTGGGLFVAIPVGRAIDRIGVRSAVLGGGLLLATGTGVFALADDPMVLGLARLAQGVGSVASWIGCAAWIAGIVARERRSEALGLAGAAGIVGAVGGPVVGGAAATLGRGPLFLVIGFAILTATLAIVALLRTPDRNAPEPGEPSQRSRRTGAERLGLTILVLGGLVVGAGLILLPLAMDAGGYGVSVVAALFTLGAAAQALATPLVGRWGDRRGPRVPVRRGCAAIVPFVILLTVVHTGPAFLVAAFATSVLAGAVFWVPGTVLALGGAATSATTGAALGAGTLAWLGSSSAGTLTASVAAQSLSPSAAIALLLAPVACAYAITSGRRATRR